MYPDPGPKRYIARKRLRVGEGWVDYGDEFPASEVTHSLLSLGWVVDATMATDVERAALAPGSRAAPTARKRSRKPRQRAAAKPVTPKEALLEERDAPTPRKRSASGWLVEKGIALIALLHKCSA